MNRLLIGMFVLVTVTIAVMAIVYPEDFAIALGALVLGFAGGMLVATSLFKTYFTQGANMVHELQKKQIINPASILREARLSEKQIAEQAHPPVSQQQPIPRFDLTGLENQ